MKGYRPPTSDGTSHHTFTHLILVYKLTKLYDVTQVTSRQIESLDESQARIGILVYRIVQNTKVTHTQQ